jgi:hypothetical protein
MVSSSHLQVTPPCSTIPTQKVCKRLLLRFGLKAEWSALCAMARQFSLVSSTQLQANQSFTARILQVSVRQGRKKWGFLPSSRAGASRGLKISPRSWVQLVCSFSVSSLRCSVFFVGVIVEMMTDEITTDKSAPGPWDDFHVVDGRVVTGTNPNSANSTAEAILEVFKTL